MHSRHQIHAAFDVDRRMQQSTYRRGGVHREWYPGMQRELHRFRHCRNQHQEKNRGGERALYMGIGPARGASSYKQEYDGREQAVAGEVSDRKYLACAVRRIRIGVPEANQEEGAQPDKFPTHVEEEQVGRIHKINETGYEDENQTIETGGALLFLHVGDRIKEDCSSDTRSHDCEEKTQAVYMEGELCRPVPMGQ